MKSFINNFILILILFSCGTGQEKKEPRDITLVVPGKSAEGFTLNETVSGNGKALQIDTTSMPEALSSITGNNQIPAFIFSRIIYQRKRYALFTDNGIVQAIAGFHQRIALLMMPLSLRMVRTTS